MIYKTKEVKHSEIVAYLKSIHKTGRPILVGTQSVHESISIANMLQRDGIRCKTLNAKCDEDEAAIIAEAGNRDSITISTNMAGRGTDIRLGGVRGLSEQDVLNLGGLCVIGTNRFESKRIDNQLRGRCGRQGDPGTSKFFISLEDDLFIKYRLKELLPAASDEHFDLTIIQKEIDRIQRIIDGQNLDIKITLCKYSGIIEQQRQIIHDRRYSLKTSDDILDIFEEQSSAKYDELIKISGKKELTEICRFISLCTIDEHWATYLEQIQDPRVA
jgi:preprotein translocase subunit SecA